MLARTALGTIWLYQRWLSPRKGFRCAYAVRHGGSGCSGYVKHTIRDRGVLAALPLARQRFRDCRAAYAAMQGETPDDPPRKRRKGLFRDCVGSCGDGGLGSCGFGGKAAAKPDARGCDINPCDNNPCDGGGCDCSPCG